VTAKKAVNVSPDAVKQNAHHLLVALTEELLTFNPHTASLLVVLMEEPLISGLRHVVDLLKVDLLQIENLDIKR
tara:strand:+ start:93 stop:314 length:222 start_codon:yes stop_codon:yes gene_type:complete